jgi:tRNA A-37 threonylcarbamoyl transferase component Bud32
MRETIGKFQIIRMIGHGAMGEVFLAQDPVLERRVAVKTIRTNADFTEEASARFEREAKSAGSLNHPNIVTVFEFGLDEGLHYLVMEFVDGEDLGAAIRGGRKSLEELLELLAQACEGLAFAHDRGIVHRDIKPANILVSRLGKRPLAKIMDFGVARIASSDLTQQGNWMGTANYMAPEYLDTGKAEPSADLFALGVVLYEILTGGRRPFAGDSPALVIRAILGKDPVPFTPAEEARLGPALTELCRRALAKRPEDRFPSADALAAAIRGAAAVPRGPAPAAEASALIVGKGGKGQCMSLRVALRQARDGMRIVVLPGLYRESLVVDKDVIIEGRGEPGEVVVESPKGACLVLDSARVGLASLTLRGAEGSPEAVLVASRGSITVDGCVLESRGGPCLGIAKGTADPLLRGCTIRGQGPSGVQAEPGTLVRLEGCVLDGAFGTGVSAAPGSWVFLTECTVGPGGTLGLRLLPGAHASLETCTVMGQAAGCLEIEAEARAVLKGCRILDSASVGVLALERGQASLEDCEVEGHALAGVHGTTGASLQLRRCRITRNGGAGAAVADQALATLEDCELASNREPAVLVARGATIQLKSCRIRDGLSFGVLCAGKGRGVLESCEIAGNAGTGAKVEPGGSLLLVRCDLRDGKDTGILLLQDAEVTLEECVVHRNARGGILLAKDASDPILRGGNRLQDELLREQGTGGQIKVAPVRKG